MKTLIKKLIPGFFKRKIKVNKQKKKLEKVTNKECNTTTLISKDSINKEDIINSHTIEEQWKKSKKKIEEFDVPDGTGGVNPGDRKVIYFLISYFQPSSVLEIGTHIGASTINIAASLHEQRVNQGKDSHLTSVDIHDVNDPETHRWLNFNTSYSPRQMIEGLEYENFVQFETASSIEFAKCCKGTFDFIFLDGSHEADIVYQEIPLMLSLLRENGVILLHDYFPNLQPLWSDGAVIPGPWLAIDRLKKEGNDLSVMPIGKVPWKTKLNSNYTSLALLTRNS